MTRKNWMHRSFATLVASSMLASSAPAGLRTGPADHFDCVLALSTDTYRVLAKGGERLIVEVRGDGDTDLDLFIYDEDGFLISADEGATDHAAVVITARYSSEFRIEVRNLGAVYNCYRLRTN